jgi:hypothetical protein
MAGNRLRRSLGHIVVVAILALVWLSGCGEGTGPDGQTADSVIVSNPVPFAAAAGFSASMQGGTVDAANEDLVFVALEPGTVPDGHVATVRKVGGRRTRSPRVSSRVGSIRCRSLPTPETSSRSLLPVREAPRR